MAKVGRAQVEFGVKFPKCDAQSGIYTLLDVSRLLNTLIDVFFMYYFGFSNGAAPHYRIQNSTPQKISGTRFFIFGVKFWVVYFCGKHCFLNSVAVQIDVFIPWTD